jgi:phosphoribosyl 1,2-cyclic phosphodiesterase
MNVRQTGVIPEALRVRLWGVRGSMNASGAQFMEFGGHTLCVEVWCGERLFILDAGSGLAALGATLGESAPAEIDILLSHLHLDHISSLPFFKPAVQDSDRVIRTHCGNLGGKSAAEALDKLFAPPLFPITLDVLPGSFEHYGFCAGETLRFDGLSIRTHLLNHPGGCTGYRFDHGGRSFCYVTDIEHGEVWPDAGLLEFVRGADLVLYDGMFSEADYPRCRGWGHSTWEKGVELCEAAGVRSLGIVHLYPGSDDATLRALDAQIKAVAPFAFVAKEGQSFSYPACDRSAAVAAEHRLAKVPAI